MILSAVTAIYIGSTSCSEAYVGDILVWPHCHYTIVDWIKGSGNYSGTSRDLYIKLPFKTSSTLSFRFKGQLVAYTGGGHITGLYSADTNDYRWFVVNASIQYLDMGSRRLSTTSNVPALNTAIDYTIGNFYIFDNLTQSYVVQGTPVADVPNTENLLVRIPLLRVEAFQAWENGTLIFDGLPAYSDCDGKYGIYDSLGGGFYTSDDTITGGSSPAPTTGYTLTPFTAATLSNGDSFVLVNPSAKTIVGNNFGANGDLAFTAFTGGGTYSALPAGTTVLKYTSTGCSIRYSGGTNVRFDWTEYSQYNIVGEEYSNGESNICANSDGRIYGINPRYGTHCYLRSNGNGHNRPHLHNQETAGTMYYIYKLT